MSTLKKHHIHVGYIIATYLCLLLGMESKATVSPVSFFEASALALEMTPSPMFSHVVSLYVSMSQSLLLVRTQVNSDVD